MASVRREVALPAAPEAVWDAVRDFGAVHTRLTPGAVTSSVLEGDERIVTFVSGVVVREVLVSTDDAARRLVYAMVSSPIEFRHYSAAIEVRGVDASNSVLVWTVDLLPDELAPRIEDVMDVGTAAMSEAFGAPAGTSSSADVAEGP